MLAGTNVEELVAKASPEVQDEVTSMRRDMRPRIITNPKGSADQR